MISTEIIDWVKQQSYWQQFIADKILRGKELDAEELTEIYSIFKQEFGLVKQTLIKNTLVFVGSTSKKDSASNSKWEKISNIQGVNALKSGEILEIGNQMTLVYGENGSGKSGYTRLLNNAFISRGDKNIISNIFKKESTQTSAIFSFSNEEGATSDFLFPDNKSHELFNKVSVFDTVSAIHDLTKETELAFAPIEFSFFDEFIRIFLDIKGKLTDEIKHREKINDFSEYFDKNTSVKKLVEEIDSKSNFEDFKLAAKVSDLDDIYKEKMKRKIELQALNVKEKSQEYNKFRKELQQINQKIELLNNKFSNSRIEKTEELLVERRALKELSSKEGLEQLKGEDIYKLGSSEWKEFIEAARVYYNSIEGEIDHCVFCGQDIDQVTVIDKYWKYLKSTAEKNLVTAESNIKKIAQNFAAQDFKLLTKGTKLEDWLKENKLDFCEVLIEAEKKFKNLNTAIIDNLANLEWKNSVEEYNVNVNCFTEVFDLLDKKVKELNSEKVSREILEITKFEDEYHDKLKLEKLLPQIEIFIKNSKWVDLARSINLSTQKITAFQSKLFSKYVSVEYIEKFDLECQKLNANFSAEIKQRGSKGTTLSKLTVKGRKPIEILSEGEQRSIALANFLAETGLNKDNICIVFDDPVCSLDYKRRELIAKRLVEEAKNKQVVILTHDITFLLSIQNHCASSSVDCCTTTIRKLSDETGIVQNSVPWIGMTVRKRIDYLQNKLQNIEKIYREINSGNIDELEKYEDYTKLWCEQLRETWERTIEEILFNNSVQRFSPAIQTQRLKKALFTKELYIEVEEGMTNCSNWVHDRASGLGEEIPNPEILNEYLSSCRQFVKLNNPNK